MRNDTTNFEEYSWKLLEAPSDLVNLAAETICIALVIWLVFFVDAMRCLISFNEAPNVAHLSYALSIFSKASLAESPLLFAAANISENSVIAASNASVSGKSFVVRMVSNKSACLPSK